MFQAVMFGAKPPNLKRLRVVVVVGLGSLSALLARLSPQPTGSNLRVDPSPCFGLFIWFPRVQTAPLVWPLLVLGAVSDTFAISAVGTYAEPRTRAERPELTQ